MPDALKLMCISTGLPPAARRFQIRPEQLSA
jgi:hypothetical protein